MISGGTDLFCPYFDRKTLPPEKQPNPFVVLQSIEIEPDHVAPWPPKHWKADLGEMKDDPESAAKLLNLWLERAWRRPATEEEREHFLKLYRASVKLQPSGKYLLQEHIELMMDLIALAFQADMTRVVTHSLGEGGPNYEEYKDWATKAGAPVRGAHDVHHKPGGSADAPEAKVLGSRDEMLCACLARLMDRLKGIAAKDGTLLDHTDLLFGGAQVSCHSGKSVPTILAGGHKLGFKHGQHVKFESEMKPMSNLYLTILQQLGCSVTTFSLARSLFPVPLFT